MVLSLLLAQWLSKNRAVNRIAQTVFFTPYLIAGISCGFIWSWLLSSQSYGLFNAVLLSLGLPSVRWLDGSHTAMLSIILMNTWKSIGYYALIILSSMKSIPAEIYEAAELDSATPMRTFFKITLPMLSPQLFFLLITITMGSLFDSVRIMTDGGPGDATRVLSLYIYDYAFQRNNSLGYACAAGVVMLLIMLCVTLVDFRFVEKKVHYQ